MREAVLITSNTRAAVYGIGTYLKELIYCLQQSGIKVTIVELDWDIPELRIEETGGVKKLLFPFPQKNEELYFNRVASLLKLYICNSPDVIFHFNSYTQKELMKSLKIKFAKSKMSFAVHFFKWSNDLLGDVGLYHNLVMNSDKRLQKEYALLIQSHQWEKDVFEKADTIIALSDDTSFLLAKTYGIHPEKIFQAANGLRDICPILNNRRKRLREQFHIDSDEIILLYIGRLDAVKSVGSLLASFKKIVAKHKNCRLILVGDGEMSVLKGYSAIMSKVIITGKIDRENVDKWYAIADIGLFPSRYEECSYVGIEMMMHSLPVVASDSYGVRCMFHDGQNALVAKRESFKTNKIFEKNLFDKISQLIESKELREQIGAEGRKIYEERYHIRAMQNNYERLMSSLME